MSRSLIGRASLVATALAVLLAANWVAAPVEEADAYSTVWVRQFSDFADAQTPMVAAGDSGVYLAGSIGTALPGQSLAGSQDAYVRKYSPDGAELWTRQFGSFGYDALNGIAINEDAVYVVGYVGGRLPGQAWTGLEDAFVRKYDHDGVELWTRQFGTSDYDGASAIAMDGSGVYVAGYTYGAFSGYTASGHGDAFVRKYDHDGNELWTRQFGSTSWTFVWGIGAGGSSVYVSGSTGGALPGQTSAGFSDAFVRKYDPEGTERWTRQFGTAGSDGSNGIAVDGSGIYIAGASGGAFPGHTNAGGYDAFLRKYDHDGLPLWTRQFGSGGQESVAGIALDGSAIYIAGQTDGTLPGQTSAGLGDVFIRKYDLAGGVLWTRQLGTFAWEYAGGVAVSGPGAYLSGWTDGGAFPGQTSSGGLDAFVMRLTADPVFCNGLPATIVGTEGDDVIHGTPGRDVIHGLGGNDTIYGHGGDDVICGGDGDDVIYGGDGNDLLFGGDGNDTIYGNRGNDRIFGGAGDDHLNGGLGSDVVKGEEGNDWVAGGWGDGATNWVSGGPGDDKVFGGDGNDFLWGGDGRDMLFGGPGDDVLFGGGGRDFLYGGPGDDTLYGGHGPDRLHGGTGNDVLYGGTHNDHLFGNEGDDHLFGEEGDDSLDGGPDTDACDGGPGTNTVVNCE